MGAELGWSPERTALELDHYRDRVAAELAAHRVPDDAGAQAERNRVKDIRLTKV